MLNIVSELAQYSDYAPASLPSLAYSTGYNLSYLEKLAALLRDHGIVKAIRGSRGGYVLTCSPDRISVAEILSAGSVTSRREPRYESRYEDQVDALCATTKEIRSAILARISLADILEDRAAAHPVLHDVLAKFRGN